MDLTRRHLTHLAHQLVQFTGRLPVRAERGASLVEYALLIALIAVVMVGAVTLLGDTAADSLDRSGSSIVDATS